MITANGEWRILEKEGYTTSHDGILPLYANLFSKQHSLTSRTGASHLSYLDTVRKTSLQTRPSLRLRLMYILSLSSSSRYAHFVHLHITRVQSDPCILSQLTTAKEPYSQEKIPIFIKAAEIASVHRPLRPVPELYPVLNPSFEFCWPLMQACWKTKQDERITSGDAHKWLCTRSPPTHLT